jgi:hypothetical protein
MRMTFYLVVACSLLFSSSGIAELPQTESVEELTDFASLDRFIHEYTDEVEGGDGRWAFEIEGMAVMVLADRAADRMRIMTPVAHVADLEEGEYSKLLEANFDRALDARYAINAGVLWSAFIHPMSSLSHQQFDNGLEQVVNLAANFGTTYASTDMLFAPGREQPHGGEAPQQPDATPDRGAPPAPTG